MRVKVEQNRIPVRRICFIAFLALILILTMSGLAVPTAHADSQSQKPVAVKTENVAKNKDASFRSFDDFSEVPMYDYFYDYAGIDGTGCRELTGNHITDGERVGSSMNSSMGTRSFNEPNMAWAYIDLGEQKVVNKVHFYVISTWHVNRAVIQLSEDGTNWTTVYSAAASPLKDSAGNTIFNDGLVNTACLAQSSYIDFTAHFLGSMTLNPSTGGYPIEFDATKARYVRMTNLISEHTNGNASNNTVFTEIEVYAVKEGVIAPDSSLKSGSYEALQAVTLTTPYDNAEIYYTLDESYPTVNSTKYVAPIDLTERNSGVMLRAVTVLSDGQTSYPANYEYQVAIADNLALGRTVTFRALGDMSQTLDMYNYFPDGSGNVDSGNSIYTFLGNYMSDGDFAWMGYKSNSTGSNTVGWAFLDLGRSYPIDSVGINFLGGWAFENVVIQVSNDASFASGVTTIFSNTLAPLKDSANNVVYDGTLVIKAGQPYLSVSNLYLYSQNVQHIFDAENVNARYVRITNLSSTSANTAIADNNTIFTEIQVFYGGTPTQLVTFDPEHNVDSAELAEYTSRYKDSHATVTAALPDTACVCDELGNEYELAVSNWTCDGFNGAVAGEYTFLADITLSNDLLNIFSVKAQTVVTVPEKSDFTALAAAVTKMNGINKTVDSKTYTTRSWDVFNTARVNAVAVNVDEGALQSEINNILIDLNRAYKDLEFLGSKTALKAVIEQAEAVNSALYTTTSKNGFADALTDAQTVDAFDDASKAEIDAAESELKAIYDKLERIGDVTELNTYFDSVTAQNYDFDLYAPRIRVALEDSYAEAEKLLTKKTNEPDDVSEREVALASTALTNANNAMANGLWGDKTALTTALNSALSLNVDDYTDSSYEALTAAITSAQTMLNDYLFDFTAGEVTTAVSALNNAVSALVSLPDKTALRAAITAAEAKQESAYTTSSFTGFSSALAKAKSVAGSKSSTADEIAGAVTALSNAVDALVARGNTAELALEKNKAAALVESRYTVSSFAALQNVIAGVDEILQNGDASAEMIAATLSVLVTAQSNLILAPDKSELSALVEKYEGKASGSFKKNLEQAKLILDNPDSTQKDVADAVSLLNDSKAAADKNTVVAVICVAIGALMAAGAAVYIVLRRKRLTATAKKGEGKDE